MSKSLTNGVELYYECFAHHEVGQKGVDIN